MCLRDSEGRQEEGKRGLSCPVGRLEFAGWCKMYFMSLENCVAGRDTREQCTLQQGKGSRRASGTALGK
jgi:hypothetical protein